MIFDGVVGATFEDFGDLSPFVIDNPMHQEQNPLFLLVPVDLFDSGVQVIVPTFTTLLTDTAVQMLRDKSPFLGAVCDNKLENSPIFFGGPGTLDVEWLAFSARSLLR